MNARGIPPAVQQVFAVLAEVAPPPGVDRQTPVKTVPSPILRMRAVISIRENDWTAERVTTASNEKCKKSLHK